MSDNAAKQLAGAILIFGLLHFLTNLHKAENAGGGVGTGVIIYNTVTGSATWCFRTCEEAEIEEPKAD